MSDQLEADDLPSGPERVGTGTSPSQVVGALVSAVPLLIGRSLRQVELASSLVVGLTCHAAVRNNHEVSAGELLDAGAVRPEPLDVLEILAEESAEANPQQDFEAQGSELDEQEKPDSELLEAELGVPNYDSLAASQVVPRLAMLSPQDLKAILTYEQAHRRRQTIMNRVQEILEVAST